MCDLLTPYAHPHILTPTLKFKLTLSFSLSLPSTLILTLTLTFPHLHPTESMPKFTCSQVKMQKDFRYDAHPMGMLMANIVALVRLYIYVYVY